MASQGGVAIFEVITHGSYSLVVTTLAGALILALAMESIKQQMERERRRAERTRTLHKVYAPARATPASSSSIAASDEAMFREWQCGRLLLHSSGLNVLTAIVWAHAASQSECLALVAIAMACAEICMAASTQLLLMLRHGTPIPPPVPGPAPVPVPVPVAPVAWHDVRMAVLGVTCVLDFAILLLVIPAVVSPPLQSEPSSCSLPQSAWLHEQLLSLGLSATAPVASVSADDLRRVIAHLPPINFLVGLSYAITAVEVVGWDSAILLGSLSLQFVESMVILSHPRMRGDAQGQLLIFTLACQWLSYAAAGIATATLYAPLTRECYHVQKGMRSEVSDERQCAVCMDGVATHAFVPCGHRCCCKGCSERIVSMSSICPYCRSTAAEAICIF